MKTKEMMLISLFAALSAICAQLTIPLPISPVPITLQVLAVCLAAAILGSRLSTLSQLIYIAVGMLGMPVFAAGASGLHTVLGPSGGYIIGFLPASLIIGKIIEAKPLPTLLSSFAAMLCGLSIIYFAGMMQLSLVTGVTLKAAFISGVAPFIGMDIAKITVGASVACSVRTILIKQSLLETRH